MDTVATVAAIVAWFVLMIGIAALLLRLIDRYRYPKISTEEIAEQSRGFMRRLENPDFESVERHFGRPFPKWIRSLYLNKDEIIRNEFEVAPCAESPQAERWYVAFYLPADNEGLKYPWPGCEKLFAFASDGCGNYYLCDPTTDDPPVLFHDHETGEISRVCEHFSEFLSWPRRVLVPSSP